MDAVKLLAERAGMALPEDNYSDALSARRKRILDANREAAKFFHSYLMSEKGKVCLDYYLRRGYTMDTIRHFGMGYAPDSWSALTDCLHGKGYTLPELVDANLTRKSEKNGKNHYYDNFRNRAIIPIIDVRGSVVAFGGRVLDDSKPKYINTSDTPCYKKGAGVFALNFAKNSGKRSLIVTEGYMDTIALHQAGFTNSIASLGTALPDEQVNLISRYADEVLLSYDSDEAGQKAVRRAIEAFSRTGVKVRVLQLKGGKDPDEILKKYGRDYFQAIVDGSSNDVEFRLNMLKSRFDTATDDGKLGFMREAVELLAGIRSEIERDIYITRLSNELSISKESIGIQVKRIRGRNSKQEKKEQFRKIQRDTLTAGGTLLHPGNAGVIRAENTLVVNITKNPELYERLRDEIVSSLFITDSGKEIFDAVTSLITQGVKPEIALLEGAVSAEAMSRYSGALNSDIVSADAYRECVDCIKALKASASVPATVNPAEMSDEDFKKLFSS